MATLIYLATPICASYNVIDTLPIKHGDYIFYSLESELELLMSMAEYYLTSKTRLKKKKIQFPSDILFIYLSGMAIGT